MAARTRKHQQPTWPTLLLTWICCLTVVAAQGLRLPDQQPQQQQQQQPQPQQQQNVQQIFVPQQPQLQQQQPQLQQQQAQQQSPAVNYGQERGLGSAFLSLIGLQQDNDPYLARTNQNCVSGDLSECFKTQALSSFDEIFYRDQYALSDFARVIRLPETQQRSLLQEPFEYSQEPLNEDSDWDQLVKYALRRAERFVKSTALEVDVPEELTEAGRYSARFIGNDIDSELDVIEDKHAPLFSKSRSKTSRKKLKKMIIPLLLVLKIFKLKLLLFLPFILGIAGLKKILGLAAIILPGLFAYFKLCRPPGGPGFGGGAFSGLFGSKNTIPEYSPQGVGSATYYHHHEHYDGAGSSPFYRQDPAFSKPYTDYYSKNYQTGAGGGGGGVSNSVSFGDAHQAAYSGYYGRSTGKDIQSEQKS